MLLTIQRIPPAANRLWLRLTLAFAIVVIIAVTLYSMLSLALAIREINAVEGEDVWEKEATFQFTQPGGVIDSLTAYYVELGSWDGIAQTMHVIQSFNLPSPVAQLGYIFTDETGRVLFDSSPTNLDEWLNLDIDTTFPIVIGGELRGELKLISVNNIPGFQRTTSLREFIAHWLRDWLQQGAIIMGLIAMIAGIVAGGFISRNLTAPLKRLSAAAQAIGERDLQRRVEIKGSTEVQQLAVSFNAMAERLKQAETLRSHLVADVAHELRTPLTVLQGNLRAILDDVYPLTKSEVAGLYDQTRLLSRLVNDLHEISQAEANKLPLNLSELDISGLLQKLEAIFAPIAEADGINIRIHTLAAHYVNGDDARLSQVMNNLL
ncbi:HAMP domain-containing protein, partial [bacterium]|nr:HAMP domain-containing protein [bacterium]